MFLRSSKLFLILFFLLFSSHTFSQEERITAEVRKDLIGELKQGIEEHKKKRKKIDLTILKPIITKRVTEWYQQKIASREELLSIQSEYEKLEARAEGMSDEQKEKEIVLIFENSFDTANETGAPACIAEGAVCNIWGCCKDLVCAQEPQRIAKVKERSCGLPEAECETNDDCCSQVCSSEKKCEDIEICYAPIPANSDCFFNPACQAGTCETVDANTNQLGECKPAGNKCNSDVECCSNKCLKGECLDNFMCLDCVKTGIKPERGKKCCKGLFLGLDGKCIPDAPVPTI
jgi:hypothetical protein